MRVVIIVWSILLFLFISGWIMNLINVLNIEGPLFMTQLVQILGVFLPPLGALLGWAL